MARILIADTHKPTRDLVRTRFAAWGHDVVSYADGFAALTAVREDAFDLVLLAADLPRLCGLEVLSNLRKDESDRPAVVILAEQGHRGVAAAAYELGADEVVFKPFTLGFMAAFSQYLVSDLENVTAIEALEAIAV